VRLRKDAKVSLLKRVPFFERCSKRDLGKIGSLAREVEYPAGTPVVRFAAAAFLLAVGLSAASGPRLWAAPRAACGLPESPPVRVDYGEASLTPDVRAVFSQPGIVVATSGPTVPAALR
jgi:hypothetical protein